VSLEASPSSSPAFDPQTWIDLLTVHALKRDMFSSKTLMTIHEGIEQLAVARSAPNSLITLTNFHKTVFERLYRSFNNPSLLKEAGIYYLDEFRMPGIALKHFDLARQFAPKDRDIEQLQKSAALAMAKMVTDQAGHSGLSEEVHTKPEVNSLMRKTVRIDTVLETRRHLDEAANALERTQQAIIKKSGSIKKKSVRIMVDFSKSLKHAQKCIVQTDFTGAFTALNEAQKLGAPVDELLACYTQLGLSTFENERMAEALDAFLITRDLAPENVEGWFNCGLVYQRVSQMDDALACYEEAVRLGPDNPKTWCNLSLCRYELGDFAGAEKAARESLVLKSDYARAWDNLAATLSAMNRLPEAAEACQQAIRIQPSLHAAWFKYGVINFQLDNLVMAMEAFSLTGDNPSYFSYVLYYMCMIEARRGELDLALQKLSEARNVDPSNELETSALNELGAAFTKIGRYTTASDFYRQIIAKQPQDFSAWLSLGTALHRGEQNEAAREAYLHATELQPDNPVAWHNLGLLASDLGDHEQSRVCFQREVEIAPNDAKAWYDLGVSLQTLGLMDESADAMEHAESLVKSAARRSSDLSAALSIVRRLNLGERVLKTE
jgi:tetratricopeptide (TPR) repeat protein